MIISDFTQPEVDYLWGLCNFAGHEREVFRMRSEGGLDKTDAPDVERKA